MTMADFHNIGLKNKRLTFQRTYLEQSNITHSTNPLPPRKFLALPAMNGPLPVELKFRENTEF